ncbi:MAG: response regulator, partial [Alphaproteobacteria bacterium]|nr:response regulator [Alphaproteobacteria bacterium]
EEYLKEFNVDFTIVSNGQEALEALENDTYSLILMDINMPVMGGIEAIGIIKGKGISTPVVALTANAVSGDQERFMEHGFDGYLAKPIVIEEMEKTLVRFLTSQPKREEMRQEEESKIDIPSMTIINMELLREELDLPDKILYKLLTLFLKSSNSNLLELKKAIDENDFNVIENIAHKIKGAAGNMRFSSIEELSGEIEVLARSKKNADYKLLYLDFEKLMNTVQEEIKTLLRVSEGS